MDGGPPYRQKRRPPHTTTVTTASGAHIRPELVAHAQTLLAAGLVGIDLRRLADCLIGLGVNDGDWLWPSDR
jgi:hypothetical protein